MEDVTGCPDSQQAAGRAAREPETLAPFRLGAHFHLNILPSGFCGASIIHPKFRWARDRTRFSATTLFLILKPILLGGHVEK